MAVGKFSVEASHIMMFARSIGDENQIYYDKEYAKNTEPGAIIAPPTFVQASAQFDPTYGLRPRIDGIGWMGSGSNPTSAIQREPPTSAESKSGGEEEKKRQGGGGGGLHAEQRYVYHRHPREGDVLTATSRPGDTWERVGRRSGKLVFRESVTEYRDQNGELVVTATSVGVSTERPVDQA